MKYKVLVSILISFFLCQGMSANEVEGKVEPAPKVLTEEFSVTHGSVTIDGQPLVYTATTGNLILKDSDKQKASIFFIAYTKDDVKETATRPVTFVTNGGPGSSAVWLHLGCFGPRRVDLKEDGTIDPPYGLISNEYSILDLTDLVFIDPISAGYSRAAPGEDVKQFHGVEEDVKYLGEFISLYLSRYLRWDSPKFFAGESYGTTRGAALAQRLHDEEHIYLNGVVFLSTVLNFQNIDYDKGNDMPYTLALPTYAATAWYHKVLPEDLQKKSLPDLLKEVEAFASKDYPLALLKGDQLTKEELDTVSKQLSRYSGLSQNYVLGANLRVSIYRYAKELLRSRHRTVGRFDSRYLGIDSDSCGEMYENDPSMDAIFGAFTAAFNQYLRTDLAWQKDERYDVIANVWPWEYGKKAKNAYLNVSEDLRDVISRNAKIQVFVASGYYDLAIPYYSTRYTFNHLGLDPSLRDNITIHDYLGGHMMYTYRPSLIQLKKDLTAYYNKTLK